MTPILLHETHAHQYESGLTQEVQVGAWLDEGNAGKCIIYHSIQQSTLGEGPRLSNQVLLRPADQEGLLAVFYTSVKYMWTT